ncbi:MAG: histidine kinase [Alphaproteobacteria bacterium CG_4_10_14_0_2_um_filter_63_37]|nr:MAG: histidine kinase [Proteobacteria bacterium CG1_02_64_396]PJA23839.1 MAG: histidine kinase [Alphaproteobacteria bacterium CG_4_10_14_0_2_um_filter_63_37]
MKLVADIMSRDVATIAPLAPAREALTTMRRHGVNSLVVDKGSPAGAYGIVTYTSLLKAIVAQEGDIDLLHVYDICAKPALSVHPGLDIRHAAQLMANFNVKRLLVLEGGDLVGIVSMSDIIEALVEELEE